MHFTSVHNHTDMSNFRLLDCINKPDQLIDRAIEIGYNGLAITDHETLSALPVALRYFNSLKEKNKDDEKIQNFKLIFGNECYIVNDLKATKANYKEYGHGFYHLILLAKDYEGYHLLKRLSSQAWVNSYRAKGMERVPLPKNELQRIVETNKGHLICSSACLGSEFSKVTLAWYIANQQKNKSQKIVEEFTDKHKSSYDIEQEQIKLEKTMKEIKVYERDLDRMTEFYINLFGKDDYYIEIQPSLSIEQIAYNRAAIDFAKEKGLKWIVTTDSHYITKEDSEIHAAYLNSKDGDREVADFYSTTYLLTLDEIRDYLQKGDLTEDEIDAAIMNTESIYNKCSSYDIFKQQEIPIIDITDKLIELEKNTEIKGYMVGLRTGLYPSIEAFINSDNEQERYFIYSCFDGMIKKKINFDELHLNRINDEITELIGISQKMERCIAQYYVTAQKLIDLMWNEGDSLVGPARGSVTGFFTAYLLDIVQMDAIKWDLPHWRHLSSTRPEYPDIDIDSQALKRNQILNAVKNFFGQFNVLNICTFGTEKSKNALLTACRGLGIDSDIGLYLSSLVPIERGFAWTLKECFEGNEEKGRKPVVELINEITKYPKLKETALRIEGIVNKRSSHASGIYIFNDGFINYVPMMRTPSGLPVTQYDMENADLCGCMKFDFLTIEALDKVRKTIDLLIEDGLMEWKGSLKKTYDSYIHPDVLDYETEDMWNKIGNNDIVALFQYDTEVGLTAARRLKPMSLLELANGNSLMRLMPKEGEINPIEKYAMFKEKPVLWDEEMVRFNLNPAERKIMHNYFDYCCGVPSAQEDIMKIVMAPEVLNKDLVVANKFRKVIAKKKMNEITALHNDFLKYGKENNVSGNLLNYVWKFVIEPQLGYGFSINHSVPYSAIALQEMNLAHHYPSVYWNCACLCIDAGARIDDDDDEEEEFLVDEALVEDYEEDDEEKEEKKTKKKSTDYGAIASAIGNMGMRGIFINPPDINKSDFDFKPDAENNRILFGLKGLNSIGDELILKIIESRPYKTVSELKEKVKLNKTHMINLIKSGALDSISGGKSKRETLYEFLSTTADTKKQVTIATVPTLLQLGLLPKEEFKNEIEIYVFNKYVKQINKGNKGDFYVFDEKALDYFLKKVQQDVINYEQKVPRIKQKWWDNYYTEAMTPLRNYIKANKDKMLDVINTKAIREEIQKYAVGSESLWEMESICFYYGAHELADINMRKYEIENFFDLSEQPEVKMIVQRQGRPCPLYNLHTITGTVIDKNKLRHTITLLTTEGIVTVKFYASQFSFFDKQISEKQSDGTKKVMEKSWFKRGNKLVITGIRRENQFIPKTYTNTTKRTLYLITKVKEDGDLVLKNERYQTQESA